MSEEVNLPAELAAVEARLAATAPAAPKLDRDRLMYEAGRAASRAELASGALREGIATPQAMGAALLRYVATAAVAATLAIAIVRDREAPSKSPAPAIEAVVDRTAHPSPAPLAEPTWTRLARRPGDLESLLASWETSGRALSVAPWRAEGASLDARQFDASGGRRLRGATPPRPTTARELLDEILPQNRTS